MPLQANTMQVPNFGRLTVVEPIGELAVDGETYVLPTPADGSSLVASVEGEGSVELIINGESARTETTARNQSFVGEGAAMHAFVASDLTNVRTLALRVTTNGGSRLRIRVLETLSNARLDAIRFLRGYARCKLCKEVIKALLNALLAFLGVPPAVFVPLDLDDLTRAVEDGADNLRGRLPRELTDIITRVLGSDGLDILTRVLRIGIGLLDIRNMAAKRACELLGYCR